MTTQITDTPQHAIEQIVHAAQQAGFSVSALCRAAEPPLHLGQLIRWRQGKEPRYRQIRRLENALEKLKASRPFPPTEDSASE